MKTIGQLAQEVYDFNVKLVEEDYANGEISEAQRDASLLDLQQQLMEKTNEHSQLS